MAKLDEAWLRGGQQRRSRDFFTMHNDQPGHADDHRPAMRTRPPPLPSSLIHPATVTRLQMFGETMAVIAFLLGATALVGWIVDSPHMRSVFSGDVQLKTNAAIGLMCVSLGAWLLSHRETRIKNLLGRLLAAVAALIGLLTVSQDIFGWNLRIDTLLFSEAPGAIATVSPNRMGPTSSVALTLLGLGLLLLDRRLEHMWPSQWLALAAGVIAIVPILGYVYGEQTMYGVARYTGISLPQAIGLLLVAVAVVMIRPDVGFMRIFAADDAGGTLLRKMLPPMIALTLVLGWLKAFGVRNRLFEVEFGEAVLSLVLLGIFLALLWSTARTVGDMQSAQRVAERDREFLLHAERDARAESERAGRVKDEFLATLSHELRTPMTAILGWAQILRKKAADTPECQQAAEIIERNARVQAQIIDDLLDMSRIVSGKLRLDVQQMRLVDVVEAAIGNARPAAENRQVRLQAVLDPHAGPVRGDPARLQQVAWNLLSNAIKFTPKGGRIVVGLERVNSHVELSVSDTGQGIEPSFLPHVFERFSQGDATAARRHGGLGIGLAVAKQLVELHGGTIVAESPGKDLGATFRIRLPLLILHGAASLEPKVHPRTLTHRSDEACVNLAGARVLTVDDEPDARMLVRRLLEECHATVTDAATAQEALVRFQEEPFDVVVSDIGLPEMDGYELIRRIRDYERAAGQFTPALALTAFARSEDRTRAMSCGYQMHAAKPIEPTELIASVASLVQAKRRANVKEVQPI